MRTAVIYSGQARSFATVARNQFFHVLRHLENPFFFVSVARDEQAKDMLALRHLLPQAPLYIEQVDQPDIPEPPDDPPFHNIYPRDKATVQAVLKQLWALDRAYDYAMRCGLANCDIVIRIRPDLAFGRFELPTLNPITGRVQCFTPYWARWGGVNDRVAVLGQEAAKAYFTTFQRRQTLWDLGCPVHPEQMINTSLRIAGIKPHHTLATEFITVRTDGTFVPMSITEVDKLEYARTH